MRIHAIVDAEGKLVAVGAPAPEGEGPKVQLRAGPGQTRHELDLPNEFEGQSPVDLHNSLAPRDLKQYVVAKS
ncbi:MAG TPA: hypothetical protein VGF51_11715 [Acidimicrobiales bacterium]|jgi:hypothetical protein